MKWAIVGRAVLLTGTFYRTLDEKKRFAVPKPLREAMGVATERPLFLAPGSDQSLSLYPEACFEALAQRLATAPPTANDVRQYRRLFFARAERIELDRQGRLRLPSSLAEFAGVRREIVLLGVQDHVEIWDDAAWKSYLDERRPHFDLLAETAFGGEAPVAINKIKPEPEEMERKPR